MENKQIFKIYQGMVSPIIKELKSYCESIERREGKERGKVPNSAMRVLSPSTAR